jgi:hypothetical protein
VSCKKPQAAAVEEADAAPFVLNEPPVVDAAPKVLAARCKPPTGGAALGEDVEIGEAVAVHDGFAVGLLRKTDAGSVGSVAVLSRDLSKVTVVDLGAPYGDAPPPRPAVSGDALYAAFYLSQKADKKRDLSIFKIDDGRAALAVTVPQQKDESLAFDFSVATQGGVVAWDEDAIGLMRGDIQVALLSPDGKSVASTRIVSGETADAELPRVVARKSGFWAVWVSNHLEDSPSPTGDAPALEGPGESRAYHWLEAVALDEHGAPKGIVKRLTSATGHVSTFDLATRDDGETLDVLARDDDQPADGTGGRILRVSIASATATPDAPLAIVSESVGHGVPDLLPGATSWLAFSDTADHVRLLPLDAARAPTDAPSLEDGLEHARPVLALDASTLLAAFPEDVGAQIRAVPCAR